MTIYKYGNPDRLDILVHERIRFTQPSALNDPFELYPYFRNVAPESFFIEHLATVDLTPHLVEAYEGQSTEWKANVSLNGFLELCRRSMETDEARKVFWETITIGLATLQEFVPKIQEQIVNNFCSKIGILSLSVTPDNALMWSHYGAQHHGIVLGFDENNSFFNQQRTSEDDFHWLRPVEYRPPTLDKSMMDLDGTDVLLRKGPEWFYEQEWRMLAPITEATDTLFSPDGDIYLFKFPTNCVTELIVGARASPELQSAVVQIITSDSRYKHVRLRRAILDHATGLIRIENIALPLQKGD